MSDQEKLAPHPLPLSIEAPTLYAIFMATPSDGAVDAHQFFEPPHEWHLPEHKLCAAMLEQACQDYTSKYVKAEDYKTARDWIFESEDDGLYSFVAVCEALHLDPNYLRKLLVAEAPNSRTYKPRIARKAKLTRVTPEAKERVLELLKTDMVLRDISLATGVSMDGVREIGIAAYGQLAWRQRALNVLLTVRRRRAGKMRAA